MRFGIHLTNQHLVGQDPQQGLREQLQLLHAAADAGWDSVWAAHHYLTESTTMLQPVPYLARLAAEVPDFRLGLGIHLLALQNPVAAAEEVATLDILSGGRVTYGTGLGYRDIEYEAGAIDGSRLERFLTNLDIVRQLWAGESVEADHPWCRLHDVRLATLPVQEGGPPVWMAANSDAAVRRAGRLADAWLINPHADYATVARQLGLFHGDRQRAGRAPAVEVPLIREVVCRSTQEEAEAVAERFLGAKYLTYADWGQDRVMPSGESFRVPFESLASSRFIVGDPMRCLEQLRSWQTLGITTWIFRIHWAGMPADGAQETLQLLANDVLPGLQ